MHPIRFNAFDNYNDGLLLCSRSKMSNTVNIWYIFRIEGMLKVFISFGIGAIFGTNQHIRRFQNSLKSR